MSFTRYLYYSAVVGGWAGFAGWLVAEGLLDYRAGSAGHNLIVAIAATLLVGAAIGAGLNAVTGWAAAQGRAVLRLAGLGLLAGGIGGAIGGGLGQTLYQVLGPWFRPIGWAMLGALVGLGQGMCDRSASKLRNGLIGGALGGLLGGLLFDPISALIHSSSGMSSRAVGFVVLGLLIGALVGLVQVALRQAWLTVLDGHRPGRQVVLADVATLGRAEFATLPFDGPADRDLEQIHLRIERDPSGSYDLSGGHAHVTATVNGEPLSSQRTLRDGDILSFGRNLVRFNLRQVSMTEKTDRSEPAAERLRGEPDHRASDSLPPGGGGLGWGAQKPETGRTPPHPGPLPPGGRGPEGSPPLGARTESVRVVPPSRHEAPKPPPVPARPSAPVASPAPAPTPASPPANACPVCHRAFPAGQRYCIVCDRHF